MSKPTVTRLFIGAFVAVVVGSVLLLVSALVAIAGGVITVGGPQIVTVDGAAFGGALIWLAIASLLIGGGALAALASWIGALLNTAQLDDRTWFVALLVLGVFSFGWIAMIAYVVAGPDSTGRSDDSLTIAATVAS
jgi:hypothetical protein